MTTKYKFNLFILIFFILSFFASAEKITLPVIAEENPIQNPIEITLDWDEKWFGSQPPTVYNHKLARIAAVLADVAYVNEKNDPECINLKNVYKKLGVFNDHIKTNYNIDYSKPGAGINQCAYSFAHKEINSGSGRKTLVFVTIRGTPNSAPEWISNINVSDSTRTSALLHEGFYHATNQVQNALIYYLLKNKIDPDNSYFLITGHSRGAAISNLLGARLYDAEYIKAANLYVYTFAAPNISQEKDDIVRNPKYNFIWNIINPEDLVPTVPMNANLWHYKKYGNMKTLRTSWNTDNNQFQEYFLPKINKYYNALMLRDYYPFYESTFIPAISSDLLTSLYPKVKNIYAEPFGLRKIGEDIFNDLFKESTENPSDTKNRKTVFEVIGEIINKKTNGALNYSQYAFFDMHCMTNYLSWMLSLNEEEIFSDIGSVRINIQGPFEAAVFDSNMKVVTRIIEGLPEITSMSDSVIAIPTLKGTIIGFPTNQEYTIAIYKDSLLPTKIPLKIMHYDSQGYLKEINPVQKLWPHKGIAYTFQVGQSTLEKSKVETSKLHGKKAKPYIKNGKLKQQDVFHIQADLSFDTDGYFEGGVRAGSRSLHGTVLTGQSITDLGKSISLSTGIGHEEILINRTIIDFSAYGKFLWALSDIEDGNNRFNFIPEARISLGFKPFKKKSVYISGIFDFHIKDFNDQGFSSDVRNKVLGSIDISDDINIVPSIRFGLRI